MAKSYGRKNSAPHRGSVSKQLLLVLVCFLLGYLSASVFDFTSLSGWVNTQLLAQHATPGVTKAVKEAQLPKPKFEFYTLLASERAQTNAPVANAAPVAAPVAAPQPVPAQTPPVNVQVAKNTPVPVEEAKPVSVQAALPAAISKNSYLVQIGSFKSKQVAERIKASLTLKGFAVNVAMVNQQQVIWYRVVVGPFATRQQAEQIKISIARSERIVGMVRKMNA